MNQKTGGRVWRFGDDISTDLIYPGRYCAIQEPEKMGEFAMAGIDTDFAGQVNQGDVLVAGRNFGCGSSREQAVISLKSIGIALILADSLARIFYRNCINNGLVAIEIPTNEIGIESTILLKMDAGEVVVKNNGETKVVHFAPFPEHIRKILDAGGLLASLRNS